MVRGRVEALSIQLAWARCLSLVRLGGAGDEVSRLDHIVARLIPLAVCGLCAAIVMVVRYVG